MFIKILTAASISSSVDIPVDIITGFFFEAIAQLDLSLLRGKMKSYDFHFQFI